MRQNHKVDVTTGAVGISDRFGIVVQSFWRVDAAFFHFDQGAYLFLRCHLVAGEGKLADVILWALRDRDRDNNRTVRALLAHIFNLHVDVTVVLIKFPNAIEILC